MHKHLFNVVGIIFALIVGGCGGSGDSPSPTPTTQIPIDPNLTVPVQTAFANVVNKGFDQTFTISGWIDESTPANPIPPTPINGSGRLTLGAGVAETFVGDPFNGRAVFRAPQVVTGTMVINGQSTSIGRAGEVIYDASTYITLAKIYLTVYPAEYTVYNDYTYPATVKAGDTGSAGTGIKYEMPFSGWIPKQNLTTAYTVASDSATSLLVTFVEDSYNNLVGTLDQTKTVYRIDTSGNVSLLSQTTLKYFGGDLYETIVYTF